MQVREDQKSSPPPTIALPKGGGAVRGIGEKFKTNPANGTGSMSVPLAISPGRAGFGPQLALTYNSGGGNGLFGLGWNLSLPAITRKTDKGLPRYADTDESDVFLLSDAEDLVPAQQETAPGVWVPDRAERDGYAVTRYRPRVEGLFARIERWSRLLDGETHWRSISRDNVTSIYGRTAASRIADPADPRRVFTWLICESWDDKGNAIVYEYAAEDSAGVDTSQAHERHRTAQDRTANRYLKRVKYGNTPSRLVQPELTAMQWRFELVLDYGEGHWEELPPDPQGRPLVRAQVNPPPGRTWPVRPDPFSSNRAGFEVRTYRLCRRVLMFHHFPAELGEADTLVRSTDFTYAGGPVTTYLTAVTQSGYAPHGYSTCLRRSLPPVEFTYSQAAPPGEVEAAGLENLPAGLDTPNYQWADLDGEGTAGILTGHTGAWLYKRNLSPLHTGPAARAEFAPVEQVRAIPVPGRLGGAQQLMDLAGDGRQELVQLAPPLPGFFERTPDAGWEGFKPFTAVPNLDWNDPNLKFIDLTGDGRVDILIARGGAFVWHESLGEDGFGPGTQVPGPRLIFADVLDTVFLADMVGDGLQDLVRVRNGEVCYWPNLGYGRFGPMVTMDNAPWFDHPELYDPDRVRLTDIDGTGVADIVYLGRDGVRMYVNHAGNGWSAAAHLPVALETDRLADMQAVDLFGNGTACLVWSTPIPGAARRALRAIDLTGGVKPHLLVRAVNNLGAETHLQYAASTRFYLADRLAGRPWLTRLPFPVHVVERVETFDRISRNRFVTRYAYHHGYFDGVEREFRGFGLVEQWDTEEFATLSAGGAFPAAANIDAASHIPPVLTRTWFHTGAYEEGGRLSRQYADEYWQEPGLTPAQQAAMLLDDTVLPFGLTPELTPDEAREAARALKGSILRQEIYALDGSPAAARPYTVSERNYTVARLQPQGENRHAVFYAHPRETVDFQYERKLYTVGARQPADPRVTHAATLAVDGWGNVLRSVQVHYGRRHDDSSPNLTAADRARQRQMLISWTENSYTNAIDSPDAHRTPLQSEARIYELVRVAPAAALPDVTNLCRFHELEAAVAQAGDGAHDLPYEDFEAAGAATAEPHRRLVNHLRTLYRHDDLSGPLPLGQTGALALPFETYQLAFTGGLLAQVYRRRRRDGITENLLTDPAAMLGTEGGYLRSQDYKATGLFPGTDADDCWWIPSGQVFYSPGAADTPPPELAYARAHFFIPRRYRDPFGQTTTVTYDAHDILPVETREPLGGRVTAGERDAAGNLTVPGNDYRVLQPRLVMDPNRNRSVVAFDALGMVAGTAVVGKPEENRGDSLAGFEADLPEAAVAAHVANPLAAPQALLRQASTRIVYDVMAYLRTRSDPQPQPAVVGSLSRETHDADLLPGRQSQIQHVFSYSDGFGREVQKKVQAEPGGGMNPRWVGSGWTIYNNKESPVRQYEPFFSATHAFEFAHAVGVSSIRFYDPLGRVVSTLHPNHTWEKVTWDPWRKDAWDTGDTVLVADPATDPDVGDYFRRLPEAAYLPTWHARRQAGTMGAPEQGAAAKAAVYAGTPTAAWVDPLGRPIVVVGHNRFLRGGAQVEEHYPTRVYLDIEGYPRRVEDARGRAVMRTDYDLLGNRIRAAGMDTGERWTLRNAAGADMYTWDSRGHTLHTRFDALRRPTDVYLRTAAGAEILEGRTVYGESLPNPEAANLRGQVYRVRDGAGVVTNVAYDFKGNLAETTRQFTAGYREAPDWSGAVPLAAEIYTARTEYDARNRPVVLTTPDGTVLRPAYNEAGLLESVEGNLRGAAAVTGFVTDIDYNVRGQRTLVEHASGVLTEYEYDPETFRLTRLRTTRSADGAVLQDLLYTHDPVGNVTHIRDDAQQTVYFRNRRVAPSADFTYDAVGRLTAATGREHLGLDGDGAPLPPAPTGADDAPRVRLAHPGDGNALGRYTQQYVYDAVGNILQMIHKGDDPAHPGWTRAYTYAAPSLLGAAQTGDRLTGTQVGSSDPVQPYAHDPHGNMTALPHLPLVRWDHRDRLRASARQAVASGSPETTWYVYDAAGRRVRKVTDRPAPAGQTPVRKAERLYLGGLEIYREYQGDGVTVDLERETLHVTDDRRKVALVETRTQGDDGSPARLIRYQHDNHVGSAALELDHQGQVISYEEYHPFGSTSYQAARSQTEAPKRYRFTGEERDEETGLNYHRERYYAPWLGRWTSGDPDGLADGTNVYAYVKNRPTALNDPTGTEGVYDEEAGMSYAEYPTCTPENPAGIMSSPPPQAVRVVPRRAPARTPAPSDSAAGSGGGGSGGGTMTNVVGGAQVVGGGMEMYAGGAAMATGLGLLFAPEPVVSKGAALVILGGVLLFHGADTTTAGVDTLATGQVQHTLTYQGAHHVATDTLGASPEAARWFATGTDLVAGVGPSIGVGLTRRALIGAAEEGGALTLGYLHRGTSEMGHNVVGITTAGGRQQFFHLVIGEGGEALWVPYRGATAESLAAQGYQLTTMPVAAEQGAAALRVATDTMPGAVAGQSWQLLGPNCTTTAGQVLQAGSISVPIWARSPILLHTSVQYPLLGISVVSGAGATGASLTPALVEPDPAADRPH